MYEYYGYDAKTKKLLIAQDQQIKQILEAEAQNKGDDAALIAFWEDLWKRSGLLITSTRWTFRLVELYYKEKRYDDAWRMLNKLINEKPLYITNIRKWQIKVLKKEKKDYSHIQQLLDDGQ